MSDLTAERRQELENYAANTYGHYGHAAAVRELLCHYDDLCAQLAALQADHLAWLRERLHREKVAALLAKINGDAPETGDDAYTWFAMSGYLDMADAILALIAGR